jgi:hypothetical protein
MGIIRRTIKQAQTDRFGFYSQAEELALNLEQKELRGEQARAFFKKNGVKDMEINELGLDELFNQEKVTQQEILDAINENRIEFEVTEYNERGGAQAPTNLSFDRKFLTFEEANQVPVVFDESGKKLDLEYVAVDPSSPEPLFQDSFGVFKNSEGRVVGVVDMESIEDGNFRFSDLRDGISVLKTTGTMDKIGEVKLVFNDNILKKAEDPTNRFLRVGYNNIFDSDYPYYDKELADYVRSDQSQVLDFINATAETEIPFEDLSPKDQGVLRKIVYDQEKILYDENPEQKITLIVDGNETPYSMIGTEDMFYSFNPNSDPRLLSRMPLDIDPSAREGFFNAVQSGSEAEIQLQAYAARGGDVADGGVSNFAKWTKFTLPGGSNAREHVFKLKLPERMFSEDAHYKNEQNQVFHLRTKDRVGPNDENILYVEEFQSDWAQTGREHGYEDPEAIKYAEDAAGKELQPFLDRYQELLDTAITRLDDGKMRINTPPSSAQPPAAKEFIKALSDAHATRDLSSDKTMKFGTRLRAMEGLRSANSVWNRDISTATRDLFNRKYIEALTDTEIRSLAQTELTELLDRYGPISQSYPDTLRKLLEDTYVKAVEQKEGLGYFSGMREDVARRNKAQIQQIDEDANLEALRAIEDYVSQTSRLELENLVDERGFMTMAGGFGDNEVNKALRKQVEDRLRDSLPQTDTFDNVLREQSRAEAMRMMEDSLAPYGLSNQDFIDAAVANARFDLDEKAKKGVEQSSPYSNFVKRAPFVTDTNAWTRLGMKYLFDFAAKEGYDGVAFTPGLVHSNRWKNPKLIPAYDNIIPQAVDKVFKPTVSSKKIEGQPTIDVADKDGTIHTSRIILMSDATKDGSTIGEKAAKRRPMLSLPIGAGILGLQAMSPEQAEAQVLETGAQDLQEQQFPMQPAAGVPSVFDPIIGGAQIVGEAISDSFIEPALRSAGAETAFEFGMSPEQVAAAGERGARMFDYEVTSPTAKRYKEAIKGGVGELAEYLMRQPAPTGRTRSGQVIPGTGRNVLQQTFQDVLLPVSEEAEEAALGIIALDPRDTPEMEEVRQGEYLPLIQSLNPV